MSRSRKKHGIVKDRGLRRSEYNRRFRRVNKQRIRMGKDPYQMNELVNQWDVCDYIIRWEPCNIVWWEEMHLEYKRYVKNSSEKLKRRYFNK